MASSPAARPSGTKGVGLPVGLPVGLGLGEGDGLGLPLGLGPGLGVSTATRVAPVNIEIVPADSVVTSGEKW